LGGTSRGAPTLRKKLDRTIVVTTENLLQYQSRELAISIRHASEGVPVAPHSCKIRFQRREMPRYPADELHQAYENFTEVSNRCARSADYNDFADLFTEDCTYVEHHFGVMHGREEVRNWIVPLMKKYPNPFMVGYTHDWVLFDEENGRVVFSARSHMSDPGDGNAYSETNWTMIDYAGDGLFSREEDIYNIANFVNLFEKWEAAKARSAS
jgi:uncharacterized protein (TIGR02246 family)